MLALFECANPGANLLLRFYFVLVQKERPGAVGIFQPGVDPPAPRIGHRLDCGETHYQQLILTGPFELDGRNAGPFDSWTDDHSPVPAEKDRVVLSQRIHHAPGETETVDAMTVRKNRHPVREDPGFAIERNQAAVKQAHKDGIARVAMKHALNVGPVPIDRGVNRRLGWYRPLAGNALAVEIYRADVLCISQHTRKTRIDEKDLRSGNPRT